MSQHTKEPWITAGHGSFITSTASKDLRQNWCISAMDSGCHYGGEIAIANARRIVACVNACAGVKTETLERVPLTLKAIEMVERIAKVESQRDELLEALMLYEQAFEEMFAQCCSNGIKDAWGNPVDCTFLNQAHSAAGRAIKKAEAK